ncbi:MULTISPECIES: FTR1 family protein [unclassified Clostridium]|uniref:FTR1 family protein n=1 Tax=unclassified Clostridium TaxID=2614128 RepID=UPI0002981D0B|nr:MULTISPECIES: FTR1 family protein [unclassified Clostridium]EKQ57938.1 MAG: high-affinity Fe2+/Pb2+ permease [Clostridium sp. Maddingley MBC34-26]
MFAPFIICFREGIEIFLVIIPLVIYFNKNKMYDMSRSVTLGGALGGVIAIIIGAVIFSQVALLNGPASELFDGILGIVLSGLILYSVVLLRKNKSFNTVPNERFISLSKKGVFIIAAITFFREFLEAILFILTSSADSPVFVSGMALLGLVCAALCVYVVAKGISNLNISLVFYILNLFLIGLGAYYFGDALDVLFSESFSQAFIVGILVYALPSYFIMIKNDLKKYINSDKIK